MSRSVKLRAMSIGRKLSIFFASTKRNIFITFSFVMTTFLVLILAALRKTEKNIIVKVVFPKKSVVFCFSVRCLLNLKYFKICMEEVPDNFIDRVVSLDHYLK